MAQVYMPKRKDNTSQALTVGGAVAGSIIPGVGTLAGAGAGQMAGGVLASNQAPPNAQLETAGGSAMSRRYQQMQDDPLLKLQESQQALSQLPPNLQQEYGPVINQAAQMERQKRGIA